MSERIRFLRARAMVALVLLFILCPFVMLWRIAPAIWEAIKEEWEYDFSAAIEIAWALIRWGEDAHKHSNVRLKS